MRRLCVMALGAALTLGGTAVAAEPLRASIERCEPRIDPQVDVGYRRIATRCPELIRLLESSEWETWLPQDWREPGNELSLGGLRELASLIERERVRDRTGPRPGTATLHDVLGRLAAAHPVRGGFLTRLRNWLDTVLQRPSESGDSAWLERLLSRGTPAQIVIETLTYLAVAAVLTLAATILSGEVRAAMALRRRLPTGDRSSLVREPAARERLADQRLDHVSLQERPAFLLRLVLERLARAGRLPKPVSLTVREAQTLADMADPADRVRLAELATAAERVRYGSRPSSPGVLSHAIEAGTQLLARLDSAPARAS